MFKKKKKKIVPKFKNFERVNVTRAKLNKLFKNLPLKISI